MFGFHYSKRVLLNLFYFARSTAWRTIVRSCSMHGCCSIYCISSYIFITITPENKMFASHLPNFRKLLALSNLFCAELFVDFSFIFFIYFEIICNSAFVRAGHSHFEIPNHWLLYCGFLVILIFRPCGGSRTRADFLLNTAPLRLNSVTIKFLNKSEPQMLLLAYKNFIELLLEQF